MLICLFRCCIWTGDPWHVTLSSTPAQSSCSLGLRGMGSYFCGSVGFSSSHIVCMLLSCLSISLLCDYSLLLDDGKFFGRCFLQFVFKKFYELFLNKPPPPPPPTFSPFDCVHIIYLNFSGNFTWNFFTWTGSGSFALPELYLNTPERTLILP